MSSTTTFHVEVEISDDEIIQKVAEFYTPGDVFPEKELIEWAKGQGMDFVYED